MYFSKKIVMEVDSENEGENHNESLEELITKTDE
jgi:hypothetical protein